MADALRRASDALGVPPEQIGHEVIRDSSHSILGLVRTGEVVIRAWVSVPVGDAGAATAVAAQALEPRDEVEPTVETPVESEGGGASLPGLEKAARNVLATLLDKMGVLAAVEVVESGGALETDPEDTAPLVLNLVGDDLGVLIGRRGETLRDLQFITRLILSRQLGAWPNVVLDVENYKARRVSSLRSLAQRMAEQVCETNLPVVLEPMPAHERRIIHLALRDHPRVYTESTGEDDERKVQILLK